MSDFQEESQSTRKKWTIPSPIDFIIPSIQPSATNDHVNKEYSEYIAQLEKRNREKKRKEELDPNKSLKDREKGFNTCFSGANKDLGKKKSKTTFIPATQQQPPVTFYATTDSKPNPSQTRRQWKPNATMTLTDYDDANPSSTGEDHDSPSPTLPNRLLLSKKDIAMLRKSVSDMREVFPSMQQTTTTTTTTTTLDTQQTPLSDLITRIQQLDTKKQEHVLKFLEMLENQTEELPVDVISHEVDTMEGTVPLVLRILSTWGSTSVGLTEIEVFNQNDKKILFNESDVTVKGSMTGSANIGRLVNGKTMTTNDKNMWQTTLPTLSYLEIILAIPKRETVSKLRIWNFNKSINESAKGVKDLEIIQNGDTIWRGKIQKGCGNNVFDYSTVINLQESNSNHTPMTFEKSTVEEEEDNHSMPMNTTDNTDLSGLTFSKPVAMPPLSIARKISSAQGKRPQDVEEPEPSPRWLSEKKESQKQFLIQPNSQQPNIQQQYIQQANMQYIQQPNSQQPYIQQSNTQPISTFQQQPTTFQQPIWLTGVQQQAPIRSKPLFLEDHTYDEEPNQEKEEKKEERRAPSRNRQRRGQVSQDAEFEQEKMEEEEEDEDDHAASLVDSPDSKRALKLRRQKVAEDSYDSLTHFKFTHMGRLNGNEQDNTEIDKKEEKKQSLKKEFALLMEQAALLIEPKNQSLHVDAKTKNDDNTFEIPSLPKGKQLTITMWSTHGDPHYIGLSGIEMFDQKGKLIQLKDVKKQVRADPPDINCLPHCSNDPRTVDKLFDGVNLTCDDMHVWLTPYTRGKPHYIYVQFDEMVCLSLLRIWNYNKSRIHSYRGAKDIQVSLDDTLVFKGEIQKAPGILTGADHYENILFTTDESILSEIEKHDALQNTIVSNHEELVHTTERPSTANTESSIPPAFNPDVHFKILENQARPMTSAVKMKQFTQPSSITQTHSTLQSSMTASMDFTISPLTCQKIRITILASWGDLYYVGLSGLQVLDENMKPIKLKESNLDAFPRDMNSISGHTGDPRTLDKLIDTDYLTCDDSHMWLIPLTITDKPYLTIDLLQPYKISGIRLYNYNKSVEDSFRGMKRISVHADDKQISPNDGYYVKKAPGNTIFDYGHTILFGNNEYQTSNEHCIYKPAIYDAVCKAKMNKLESDSALLPCGFVFKFMLLSNHGDAHYIGLNGIEFYDAKYNKITIHQIYAHPNSVRDHVPNCSTDERTLDKLIDGIHDTHDDKHMWLTPLLPNNNQLYIVFDDPVPISMIKFWNYSKTPSRGVEEFELYVDDALVYKSILRAAPSAQELPNVPYQTILFGNDLTIMKKERKSILFPSYDKDQDIILYNNNKLMDQQSIQKLKDVSLRKKLHSMPRPMTATVGKV